MLNKSAIRRRYKSLTARVVFGTVSGCLVLCIVALFIGMSLYGLALSKTAVYNANALAAQAKISVTHGTDAHSFAESVMSAYGKLTEEQRRQTDSPAYKELFRDVDTSRGSTYDVLVHILRSYKETGNVYALYIAMYDEKNSAMVYIVDPDKEKNLLPGQWESVERKGMEKFLRWDGNSLLYDTDKTEKYGWMCTTGVPLTDENGDTYAFILVDVNFSNIRSQLGSFALQLIVAMLLITAVIALLMARRMKKRVADPINAVSAAALRYSEDKKAGVSKTDHFSGLDIRTHDELRKLGDVMSNMEHELQDYEQRITAIVAERERNAADMNTAMRIQQGMLPQQFPPFPDRHEFDIFASMDPAKEVGGDFYDFFLIDDDHLGLVMADVSGKGVPAALFMMISKVILQNSARYGRSAGEILTNTNTAICSKNKAEMFVTVWLGILEISTGKLTAANAGHEYPAIRRAGGDFQLLNDKHGLVIGAFDGIQYKEYELKLGPGDKLFLYTDGVPEATDSENSLFGTGRMLEALNIDPEAEPQKILENVSDSINTFVKDAEQFDDLTMMCIRYNGKE